MRRSWRNTKRSCCGGLSWASFGRNVAHGSDSSSAQSRLTRKKHSSQLTLCAGALGRAPALRCLHLDSPAAAIELNGDAGDQSTIRPAAQGHMRDPPRKSQKKIVYPEIAGDQSRSCDNRARSRRIFRAFSALGARRASSSAVRCASSSPAPAALSARCWSPAARGRAHRQGARARPRARARRRSSAERARRRAARRGGDDRARDARARRARWR